MPEKFVPNMKTTAIGSLPLTDAKEACRLVLENGIDIPFWPQLPKRDFRELMNAQYSEGMPCLKIDESEKRIWCEVADDKSDVLIDEGDVMQVFHDAAVYVFPALTSVFSFNNISIGSNLESFVTIKKIMTKYKREIKFPTWKIVP